MKHDSDNKNEKREADSPVKKHHFLHAIFETDKKSSPMPPDAAESILKKILTFFFSYRNNTRRGKNGKN